MNYAIILAGGTGSRMNMKTAPKQFLMVKDKPIISYCMETFEKHELIDKIVIVVADEWKGLVTEWIHKENICKAEFFAEPGRTRQHSIYNGLQAIGNYTHANDIVVIHDAARPCVTGQIITDCIEGAIEAEGAMPVITVKDTIYVSEDGNYIDGLLNRDELYAGQAPESFRFERYYKIHQEMSDEEIGMVRGSSEIAYKNGMKIKLVKGSEINFKITTAEDLNKFKHFMDNNK